MPCCCKNLQVALDLGIILLLVELVDVTVTLAQNLTSYREFTFDYDFDHLLIEYCVAQFADTFFNVILVIGATTKKTTAILIWIVLAIIKLTYTTIATILLIKEIHYYHRVNYDGSWDGELHPRWIILGIAIATILFYTWAIIVARNAIKEITDEGNETRQPQEMINPISSRQPQGMQLANFWQKLYCCFGSNVKAVLVLGIIYVLLEIILRIYWLIQLNSTPSHYGFGIKYDKISKFFKWEDTYRLFHSKLLHHAVDWRIRKIKDYVVLVFFCLFNGILVFGAKQRNGTAILVWMVFAVIRLILLANVYTLRMIYAIKKSYHISDMIDVTSTIDIAIVVLYFWAMVLAQNARSEIAKTSNTQAGIVQNQTHQPLLITSPNSTEQSPGIQMLPLLDMEMGQPSGIQKHYVMKEEI